MLSYSSLAVTLADANAYAEDRGWSNWTGDDDAKTAALRRAQDFIAGEYNSRWLDEWENDDSPENVRLAIFEGARRELASPGVLSPDVTLGSAKVLTGVGPVRWSPVKANATADDMMTTFTSIRRLLSGLAAVESKTTTVTHLARA